MLLLFVSGKPGVAIGAIALALGVLAQPMAGQSLGYLGPMPMETGYVLQVSAGRLWARSILGEIHEAIDGGKRWRKVSGQRDAPTLDIPLGIDVDASRGGLALVDYAKLQVLAPGADAWTPCLRWPKALRGGGGALGPTALAIRGDATIAVAMGDPKEDTGAARLFVAAGCGRTWREATPVPAAGSLKVLQWTPARTLLAGHACGFFLSDSRQTAWTRSTFEPALCAPNVDTEPIRGVQFLTADDGFLSTAGGRVYRTANGGRSWTQMNREVPQSGRMTPVFSAGAICFLSADRGWMVGQASELLQTADGGRRWEPAPAFGVVAQLAGDAKHGCFAVKDNALYRLGI